MGPLMRKTKTFGVCTWLDFVFNVSFNFDALFLVIVSAASGIRNKFVIFLVSLVRVAAERL